MNYRQAIEYMQTYPDMERGYAPGGQLSMSLDAMRSTLARLGNPQEARGTVHVTGSKGKGSTSTMIAALIKAGGKDVAVFTSPHLHEYTERIQINASSVGQNDFAAALGDIQQAVETEHASKAGPITTFGILTALFFQIARQKQVDWQVVEVGLGGADDATNVMAKKDVVVITPVSIEHAAILGKTPSEIAARKAGIIVAGCRVVLAPQRDAAVKAVVGRRCRSVGAQLIDVQEQYRTRATTCNAKGQICTIEGPGRTVKFHLPLLGSHQADNAATALAAIDAISATGYGASFAIDDQAAGTALSSVRLPGRVEILQTEPIIIADGAHNGESAGALREALKLHFQFNKCLLVLGVNKDKDADSIISELSPLADTLIATRSANLRAMDPEQITSMPASASMNKHIAGSVAEAIDLAASMSGPHDLICVAGSFYVVAEARDHCLLSSP